MCFASHKKRNHWLLGNNGDLEYPPCKTTLQFFAPPPACSSAMNWTAPCCCAPTWVRRRSFQRSASEYPDQHISWRTSENPRTTPATGRRSGAPALVPLPDQLLDCARQSRLEVDQLRPCRGHDDPNHAVVERTHLRLPLDPLLARHRVGPVHLEILVRNAVDNVELGPTADEQDLGRVHLGVDRQRDRRVLAQRWELRG